MMKLVVEDAASRLFVLHDVGGQPGFLFPARAQRSDGRMNEQFVGDVGHKAAFNKPERKSRRHFQRPEAVPASLIQPHLITRRTTTSRSHARKQHGRFEHFRRAFLDTGSGSTLHAPDAIPHDDQP